jgi:benzoylformate decarboxylase
MPSAAEAFVQQLAACGVRHVFGNPGTTEYAVLDAIQGRSDIDFMLTLHEGVAVSAAAGYARASGTPGVVELHAAPGLGNGVGMIYDAWAGQTPLVVYVGQADQAALYLEPTLAADLVAMARPVSKWAYEIRTPGEVPQVVRRAMKFALTPPYGPVVLSLPMDVSEAPCSGVVEAPSAVRTRVQGDPDAIGEAVRILLEASAPIVVPGDGVARSGALTEVAQLAELIGAPIRGGTMSETAVRPGHPLMADRLHYGGAEARSILAQHDVIVAIGTKVFTQLFPLPGDPAASRTAIHIGLDPWELGKSHASTLIHGDEQLVVRELTRRLVSERSEETARLWSKRRQVTEAEIAAARAASLRADQKGWDSSPMSSARAASEITEALPSDACIVDETNTAAGAFYRYFQPRPGRWFRARGGGIGEGLPMALGVKVARPDSPVVALVGDGSAMYSLTAFWTAVHHQIPVVWVILNNQSYRILEQNAVRRRTPDRAADPFVGTSLTGPVLDFGQVAAGMGANAIRVEDPRVLADAVRTALASGTPTVIDLLMGKV